MSVNIIIIHYFTHVVKLVFVTTTFMQFTFANYHSAFIKTFAQ